PIRDVARPRVALPLLGRREHGVDVAEQAERRPLLAAAQARDEVRPVRDGAEQLALEADGRQPLGEELLARPLVAGWVDGSEADQPLQQRDRLGLEIGGHRAPCYPAPPAPPGRRPRPTPPRPAPAAPAARAT